jgi:DNA-directed RNA polymerase specialized sigma24 family protein
MVGELSDESITRWLQRLKAGDRAAAQKLWQEYFLRLVAMARSKLRAAPRRAADEEDVALSAFDSFCRGAERGRFPQLDDRDDLWQLLVVITGRKAIDLINYERRQKRGGGASEATDTSSYQASADRLQICELEDVLGREPSPEFAAQMADECRCLFAALGDPELVAVANWKMEGFTNPEIASKLDCAPRTVERKLQLIRRIWSRER